MTGIKSMFAELSGDEPDWFQLAFCWERARETRLERQRECQRLIEWRKRGGPPGKRGRPRRAVPLTLAEKRARNLAYQLKWQAKQKGKAA